MHQPRELYSTAIGILKRKHFSSTQPCRPGRCINCNQQSKDISGAAVYHQRGVAVYQQPSKSRSTASLDYTACRPVRNINRYQHIRRICISPAQCSCISTAIRNKSESISGRHSRVHQGGISTAKAANQQPPGTKAKALLVDTAASTWAMP